MFIGQMHLNSPDQLMTTMNKQVHPQRFEQACASHCGFCIQKPSVNILTGISFADPKKGGLSPMQTICFALRFLHSGSRSCKHGGCLNAKTLPPFGGSVCFGFAEEEGFEPPVPAREQRFSRPPQSTTLPFLRSKVKNIF